MPRGQGRKPTKTIVIITKWIDSVDSYIEAKRNVEVKRPKKCPACGGKGIIFWAGYWRYVAVNDGRSEKLFIHRVHCKSCDKTHSVIPWFILTKRAYPASLIGGALTAKIIKGRSIRSIARNLSLPRRTISGWIKRFDSQVENIYNHGLFLIRYSSDRPPPTLDKRSGAIIVLQKIFSLTQFFKEQDHFWCYVSLLSRGRILTNTTSPFSIRHLS